MKNIRNTWKVLLTGSMLFPLTASAQTGVAKVKSGLGDIGSIINALTNSVVKSLATLFATAAMVAFFFGIVQFIWGTRDGDATKAKNGKNFMLWGLVALFVMFSVWGIITYVQDIFGVTENTITIPTIEINTGTSGGNNGTGGLPADGTSYWRCNGQVYTTQAAYNAACPNNSGTSPSASGGAPAAGSGSGCTGKPEGSSCTTAGRAGTCDYNEDRVFGCYVTAGSAGGAGGGSEASCENMSETARANCLRSIPCADSSQVRDANGTCISPAVY